MANVVALIQDERVRQQIDTFLNEMQIPDLRTAYFTSVAEFEALYFNAKFDGEPIPPADGEVATELRLFSEVHMVIFALDVVGQKGAAWLDHLRASMAEHNHVAQSGLRVVLLKYEDDNVSKLDLLHLNLDDLIYLPLDRLVFMQKMQIFLNLPKRVSPTFLFNQEFKKKIEISKITKLERLNDVALAIRNPVPLRKGLIGHFYLTLPGDKEPTGLKGKVLRSEPLNIEFKQHVVYFSFFGLTKAQTTAIRRVLQKDPHYKSLENDDPARFRANPDDLFATAADKHRFGVVIIDRDEHEAHQLAQSIGADMDRLDVQVESSYSLFLHRYLDRDAVSFADHPPAPTRPEDFFAPTVTFKVRASDQSLLEITPEAPPEAKLLDHPVATLNADGGWSRMIADRATRVLITDAPTLCAREQHFEKVVVFTDAGGGRRAVILQMLPADVEGVFTLAITPATTEHIRARAARERKVANLEVLVVEADILPPDPRAWIEGLRNTARELSLTSAEHELKAWVVSGRDEVPEAWLNAPEVLGVFRKPVDQRQVMFSFSENLGNKNTRYRFDNLGWTQPGLSIHVSKVIDLEAVSEYGATLRSTQALAPGTMIYLRKSIFDHAPNQCLAARVYASEPDPADASAVLIFTTYWGISDAFLKFARTWIRENYAASKGKEG